MRHALKTALTAAALALLAPLYLAAEPSTTSFVRDGGEYHFDVIPSDELIDHEDRVYWVIMPNVGDSRARVRLFELVLAPEKEDGDPWRCMGDGCFDDSRAPYSEVDTDEILAISTSRRIMKLGLELESDEGPKLPPAQTGLFPGCDSKDDVLEEIFKDPDRSGFFRNKIKGAALLTLYPTPRSKPTFQCLR